MFMPCQSLATSHSNYMTYEPIGQTLQPNGMHVTVPYNGGPKATHIPNMDSTNSEICLSILAAGYCTKVLHQSRIRMNSSICGKSKSEKCESTKAVKSRRSAPLSAPWRQGPTILSVIYTL